MGKIYKFLLILSAACMFAHTSNAQNYAREVPYFTFGNGLGISSPDSLFFLNIRFRMQNRVALESGSLDELHIDEVEARVRRLRLRFDGFIYDPRLTYVIQLSFSRGDQDWDNTQVPNIVRDAMVFYKLNDNLTFGLGQTKIPGNRQRVVSSGDLQFPDRSILNATFNLDRDYGVFAYYRRDIQNMQYQLKASVTSGEGRNSNSSDEGLAYTGRVELLPLGKFERNGDYFEGDFVREQSPKLSVAYTYSYNDNARRTAGQLGGALFQTRDLQSNIFDIMFKYNGIAVLAEYISRSTPNPITVNPEKEPAELTKADTSFIYTGFGYNLQTSYIFKNNYEVAFRYTSLHPSNKIENFQDKNDQYIFGVSKYIKGHRVKVQSDVTYNKIFSAFEEGNWEFRFQIEMGI